MNRFLDRLAEPGILVADGATGTMLQMAGLPRGCPPERWNLENPDAIQALHTSYLQAGADIILTNTFGGSRVRLERDELAGQSYQVNYAAAQIAVRAAKKEALVLGDIGPTGQLLKPYGKLSYLEAVDAFTEQAAALAEGGVDGFIIETMSDLNEVYAALEGINKVSGLPVLASLSFDTNGHTMMGVKPGTAAAEIWARGVAAVGANCGRSLTENLTAIREMRRNVTQAVLLAKPNAGLPRIADKGPGEFNPSDLIYDVTPETMAEYALLFAAEGVKIFGGCCGSTPLHIQAAAEALHR
jgi:5-methyltetrahydrofolate--homocysteine methyltransferase